MTNPVLLNRHYTYKERDYVTREFFTFKSSGNLDVGCVLYFDVKNTNTLYARTLDEFLKLFTLKNVAPLDLKAVPERRDQSKEEKD